MLGLCEECWRTSRQEGEAFLERVRVYALPDAAFDRPVQKGGDRAVLAGEHEQLAAMASDLGERDLVNWRRRMREFYTQVGDILATMAEIVRPTTLDDLLDVRLRQLTG